MNTRLNHSGLPLPLRLTLGAGTAAAMLAALWFLMSIGPGGTWSAEGLRVSPEVMNAMSWTVLMSRLTATLVALTGLAAILLIFADERR